MGEVVAVGALIAAIVLWLMYRQRRPEQQGRPEQMSAPARDTLPSQVKRGGTSPPKRRSSTPVRRDEEWLAARWALADTTSGKESGLIPSWFHDPPTERQLERLKNDGIVAPPRLTKGMASDLIGLRQPVRSQDAEVLALFKKPIRGLSETQGRHEVALLLSEPANRAAWEKRPAKPMQKQFLRWFGLGVPKGLTFPEAERLINEHKNHLSRAEQHTWDNFETFVEELDLQGGGTAPARCRNARRHRIHVR